MSREKEIRNLIFNEANEKGWVSDIVTVKSGACDFTRCLEQYESLCEYRKDFSPLCDDLNLHDYSCEECWKKFIKGE